MNIKVLKSAEKIFLKEFPGGFNHPAMIEVAKRHKMDQLETFAKEHFKKNAFDQPLDLVDNVNRLVAKSSLVSMFEKPKFGDMVKSLSKTEKEAFAEAYFNCLHSKKKAGFEALLTLLKPRKLAKWTLITVVNAYYRPETEIFIKPTTAKLIVEKLELDCSYHATPSWDFYSQFRQSIKTAKEITRPELAPNNPAYCGFLMMTLGDL